MLDAIRQRPDRTPATFFRYDSYGATKAFQKNGTPIAAGFELTDLLYTGQRWDAHSRLYYYQTRFYDPRIAQFVSSDPAREYPNPYAYVGWNPISFTDPTGLYSEKDEFVDDDGTVYSAETVEVTATRPSGLQPDSMIVFSVGGFDAGALDVATLGGSAVIGGIKQVGKLGAEKAAAKGAKSVGKGFLSRFLQRLTKGKTPSLDALSQAASAADRGGLSAAGRSLTKHGAGARSGNALLPAARGNPTSINQAAQEIVDDILTAPGTTIENASRGRFGSTIEVTAPDGRGIVYDASGRFLFFKE